MCYIFECIVIIVTFSLVWTALLLFHRCPFSFNNQVHTGRFCSSFVWLFWQLITLIAIYIRCAWGVVCVCICHFDLGMAMKNCFWTFQPTKGPIVFIALAFILLYKSFGLLDDRFQLCVHVSLVSLFHSTVRERECVCLICLDTLA